MAQLSTGPRYAYLVEELKTAITSCMFDLGGDEACAGLQFVLDALRLESALGDAAQEARVRVEELLRADDNDAAEARRQHEAGFAEYTPLAARMERMSDADRRSLARALTELVVRCVEQETLQRVTRIVGRPFHGGP